MLPFKKRKNDSKGRAAEAEAREVSAEEDRDTETARVSDKNKFLLF